MAAVTKKFRDNYEFWIARKLDLGEFTRDEADELKAMIRQDLTEGPDQLREGLTVIIAEGVVMPATIDDHLERYRLWDEFFEVECGEMRDAVRKSATGINARIRA